MNSDQQGSPVVVVGAGVSGVACARALDAAGVPVVVLDRGRRIGGRMASRRIEGRPVDLGASYFTVGDDRFRAVVDDWQARGLALPWTDTFDVRSPGSPAESKSGPVRWRAPGALRSLVEDLATGLDVRERAVASVTVEEGALLVDGEAAPAVVLAMPDPQATALLGAGLSEVVLDRAWEPVLALVARFETRSWSGADGADFDGAFVNDDPDLDWIADDGRRRGDDAPVLVAHSTTALAGRHLDEPDAAGPELVKALRRVMDLPEPVDTLVKRWSVAKPAGEREDTHLLREVPGGWLGACGDGWGSPKVEGAYLSGRALGEALVSHLA